MSDEEFLARWSRRKQEARAGDPVPQPAEPMRAPDPAPPTGTAETSTNQDVALSSLPPIESIDAATDITEFLREGIPQELSRAALRRAWTADPAIRDFIGLAENAWDFNDPNAMPGFGPLDCSPEQVDALVGRVVGGVQQVTERLVTSAREAEDAGLLGASERDPAPNAQESNPLAIAGQIPTAQSTMPVPDAAARQPAAEATTEREQTQVPRRAHGGALPC
jgi:hypothetical protein